VTETVWDSGLTGTASTDEGRSLAIGDEGAWTPEHLLLFAAEGSYMASLLSLVQREGIDVLGYLSTAELHPTAVRQVPPSVLLLPCIVVGSDADAERVRAFARDAIEESPIARLLGDRLQVVLDVRAVVPALAE
jgi:hypothetical protein